MVSGLGGGSGGRSCWPVSFLLLIGMVLFVPINGQSAALVIHSFALESGQQLEKAVVVHAGFLIDGFLFVKERKGESVQEEEVVMVVVVVARSLEEVVERKHCLVWLFD